VRNNVRTKRIRLRSNPGRCRGVYDGETSYIGATPLLHSWSDGIWQLELRRLFRQPEMPLILNQEDRDMSCPEGPLAFSQTFEV